MKMITNCNSYKITTYNAGNPRKKFIEVSKEGKRTIYVTNSFAKAVEYARKN